MGDWFSIKRPCDECPFTRQKKAVRLLRHRAEQIAGNMLSPAGEHFPCHKVSREVHGPGAADTHCAGALIFAEKHETATQMMRIAERIGSYDPRDLEGHELVFDSIEEMMATALDAPGRRRRR